MLMSKERQQEYFNVQRSDWIDYARPDNYLIAKPLARAHDGLNPEGDDAYSEGLWKNIFRSKGRSNYESHLDERIKEGVVKDGKEYRELMNKIINNDNAEVYKTMSGKEIRYLVKDGDWLMMLDINGHIHSTMKLRDENYPLLQSGKKIGTLNNFIGITL